MKLLLKYLCVCLLLPLCVVATASVVDEYEYDFKSDEELYRFRALANELRCPKCQNQNLAESHAPIADDLRKVVFKKMQEGLDDDGIKTYLVERYGDFVLYKPRITLGTLLLWLSPFILLLMAIFAVFKLTRHRDIQTKDLTLDEQTKKAQAAKLLNIDDKP